MAKLYWVGGSGNTNDPSHYALTTGGAGGAGLPDATTDVETDANSSASGYTITFNATFTCRDFVTAAPATGNLTLAGTATKEIWGTTFYLYTGILFSGTVSNWNLRATSGTVAMHFGGVVFGANGFNMLGSATYQLQDTLRMNGNSALQLGSSATFDPNGQLVELSAANISLSGSGAWNFYDLTVINSSGPSSIVRLNLPGNITVSNLFTSSITAGGMTQIRSTTRGAQVTITAANVAIDPRTCFADIVTAGAADWDLSGIDSGDCGNNGGTLVLAAPVQLYWYHGASAGYNWSDSTRWFLGSGGTGGAGRVPLPQDPPPIFDSLSFPSTGKTVTQNCWLIPGWDFSLATNAPTLTTSTACSWFGTLENGSSMTLTGSTQTYTYEGRGSSLLISAGKSWAKPFTIDCVSGTLTLGDAFITAVTTGIDHRTGTFTTGDFNVTASFYQSSTTSTRALNLGSSTFTLIGNNNNWNAGNGAGMTLDAGTSTIRLTGTYTGAKNWAGAGLTYYRLENATTGAFALQITGGNNTFTDGIYIDASAAARTVQFTAGTTTTVGDFTRDAGTNVITIGSITSASHTLTKTGGGTIIFPYADISYSTATPGSTWYAGNSTDSGHNSGWNFVLVGIGTTAYSAWENEAAVATCTFNGVLATAVSVWVADDKTALSTFTSDGYTAYSEWQAPSKTATWSFAGSATTSFSTWTASSKTASSSISRSLTTAKATWYTGPRAQALSTFTSTGVSASSDWETSDLGSLIRVLVHIQIPVSLAAARDITVSVPAAREIPVSWSE